MTSGKRQGNLFYLKNSRGNEGIELNIDMMREMSRKLFLFLCRINRFPDMLKSEQENKLCKPGTHHFLFS